MSGMHGRRRKTLHTVGAQGCRSNTLQTAPAGDPSSMLAPAARAASAANRWNARMRIGAVVSSRFPGSSLVNARLSGMRTDHVRRSLFFDGRLLDVIQIRKVLLEVSVPFALPPALIGAPT